MVWPTQTTDLHSLYNAAQWHTNVMVGVILNAGLQLMTCDLFINLCYDPVRSEMAA